MSMLKIVNLYTQNNVYLYIQNNELVYTAQQKHLGSRNDLTTSETQPENNCLKQKLFVV